MRRFLSIRSKIFLYIFILMVIPIIAITFIANYISGKSLLEQTRINDLQTIGCMQESTETLLDSVEALGHMIAADPEVQNFLRSASSGILQEADSSDVLNHYLEGSDSLLGASLINADHSFVGETRFNTAQLQLTFSNSFFRRFQQAAENAVWTDPHILQDSHSSEIYWAISCASPIYSDRELMGYLILYMDRCRLDRLTQNLSDTVYIINDAEATDGDSFSSGSECYIISDKTYSSDDFSPYTASFYYKSKINYNYLVSGEQQQYHHLYRRRRNDSDLPEVSPNGLDLSDRFSL